MLILIKTKPHKSRFFNLKYRWGGAGLSRLSVRFEKFCRTRPYPGGNPNIEEAEAHLNKYQLLSDHSMTSLIAQRSGSNPLQSRELTLSISEEFKKNFKVIADIKVPVYLDLQAQIEQVKKEVYEFTLTVKVEF